MHGEQAGKSRREKGGKGWDSMEIAVNGPGIVLASQLRGSESTDRRHTKNLRGERQVRAKRGSMYVFVNARKRQLESPCHEEHNTYQPHCSG